jgi:hypothetical protein
MAAGDGLISMTPSSIAHSGTSATINADGGVDFTAVTSLSLNGVFTSDYDNYLVVMLNEASVTNNTSIQMRAAGSNATGSNYAWQYLDANGTTVDGNRFTSQTSARFSNQAASIKNGFQVAIYGPFLAQPTAGRSVTAYGQNSAQIFDIAWTHSLSTSYDGFTIATSANNITGNIHVFGYEE